MDVKAVIKAHGMTQAEVAQKLGINPITLSQKLSRNPTVKTLQGIADVVGCKVGDFFRDEISGDSTSLTCPNCGANLSAKKSKQQLSGMIY